MELNSFLQRCNDDDVLELNNQMIKLSNLKSNLSLALDLTYNQEALLGIAKCMKSPPLPNTSICQLFNNNGLQANILRIGSQGWKKGKVKLKLTLEFCPDEPDIEEMTQSNPSEFNSTSSPLDDIRQMINK